MRRIPPELLARMATLVSDDDRDEMAIPSYLHRNPAMRWMAWRRVEVVARCLRELSAGWGSGDGRTVMDFGCGTGVLLDEASRLADGVFGVDVVLESARLLVETWELPRVRLLHPDEARSVIPEASLDVIIAAEVLEHIDPLADTLAFFRSRLKKQGDLLASLPTESLLYRAGRRLAGFGGHYHHADAAAIHRQILDAGFRQVRMIKVPAPGPFAIYWVVHYRHADDGRPG